MQKELRVGVDVHVKVAVWAMLMQCGLAALDYEVNCAAHVLVYSCFFGPISKFLSAQNDAGCCPD
jgi:hypothetical protein